MAIIPVITLEELKELQAKILFSRTDKITKISDGSVVNGFMFANAKGIQKALKDIAISQAHYYPDASYGAYLDNTATQYGLPLRFGALGSSLYARLVGDIGTVYIAGTHNLSGSAGVVFTLEENVTIGDIGFAYGKFASVSVGANTNVRPLSLTTLSNVPVGHIYVVNEYNAIGGRDVEDDESFRQRIKNSFNIVALGTLAKIEQAYMSKNPNVLRVFNHGTNSAGKVELAVLTQNGADLTALELEDLNNDTIDFFSMSEINLEYLANTGIVLRNVNWLVVDISFRVKLKPNYVADEVRKNVQLRINKYIDYRTWQIGQKVEWDNILQIVKDTEGVSYVPDNTFVPSVDIPVDYNVLPRIRGFEMRDLQGDIISDGGNALNPVYYPQSLDFNYIKTALRNL